MEVPSLCDMPLESFITFLGNWIACQPEPQQTKLEDALKVLTQMLAQFNASRGEC